MASNHLLIGFNKIYKNIIFANHSIAKGIGSPCKHYITALPKSKRLIKFHTDFAFMVRKFEEWWKTVPADLKQKARKGDEANKPLLNQINYVLLHLHLAGKHDAKPTHDELKDWLHSGQVDVLRMNK
jgi:hypothetical protein